MHITVDTDDDFALWFGEAKFYSSIQDVRLGTVIDSVRKSLRTDKLRKENAIIVNVRDLDELGLCPSLCDGIKAALAPSESIDHLKRRINVPILLLHECSLTAGNTALTAEYLAELREFHNERAQAYFRKQANSLNSVHQVDEITFHLILFPVPNKPSIVDRFVRTVSHFKD